MNGAVMFPSSVRTNTTLYKLSVPAVECVYVVCLASSQRTRFRRCVRLTAFLVHLLIAYQNSSLAVDGTHALTLLSGIELSCYGHLRLSVWLLSSQPW